jgi:hypothetical protein
MTRVIGEYSNPTSHFVGINDPVRVDMAQYQSVPTDSLRFEPLPK